MGDDANTALNNTAVIYHYRGEQVEPRYPDQFVSEVPR